MTAPAGIDAAALRAALRAECGSAERDVAVHAEIDSTSDELKRRLAAGAAGPGALVIAAAQTRGRGRQGRSWFSPADGHLYASLAVAVRGPAPERVPLVPLAAGVAAAAALDRCGAPGILLKWPNDLRRDGRKVGGILCEAASLGADAAVIVVGLGANTGRTVFTGEPAAIAACVAEAAGPRPEAVAAAWVAALERWAARISAGEIPALVAAWRERAEPFGRRVRVAGLEGVTVGVDAGGHLLLRTAAGAIEAIPGGIVEDA